MIRDPILAEIVPLLRIDIITLFPEAVLQCLGFGVVGRAIEQGLLRVVCTNPRDFTTDNYRRIDERVYGGGPGMVMLIEPLLAALRSIQASSSPELTRVSYLTPQGPVFSQAQARSMAARSHIVLICGRYEGIDQRFVDHYVDEEISIGDYVLSGGELAAAVVIDAVVRLLPGVLNKAESADQDSFENGLLDCPHYTRPELAAEGPVPEILKSGDHAKIARWRRQQSLGRTWLRRPDLLAKIELTALDQRLLAAFQREWELLANKSDD
jgi:tRNA (guanine37-N1)-methyltransferase